MGIEGIVAVFYGPDFVTVSKDSEHPWSVVKPEVYATLMEYFSSGQPLFRSEEDREAAGPQDTRILDTDSETVAMIKELLETRVRPAIMEDGGDIEYRGFDESDGLVRVKLKGSCRGCESSSVTLKSGIERMLMHYIPEVLDQEEEIALNEFQKLEEKLSAKQGEKDSRDNQVAKALRRAKNMGVYVNNKKFACESCIKGHRSSSCHHTDRPLFEIKKKGRPVSQCTKCRELRQSKKVHSKCTCDPSVDKARQEQLVPLSAGSKSKRYIPVVPALPNGLKDLLQSTKSANAPPDSRQKVDSLLNPCSCGSPWNCNCLASASTSSHPAPKPNPPSLSLEALAHAASLHSFEQSTPLAPANTNPTSRVLQTSKVGRFRTPSPPGPSGRKRSKQSHSRIESSPGPSLAPIRFLPPAPSSLETPSFLGSDMMPSISEIQSLAGSGCTCGVQCACPGCVQHRGPEHASQDHKDCSEGCGTCVDHSTTELPFNFGEGLARFGGPSPGSASYLDQFFARAAALPPPPLNRKFGLDPTDTSAYRSLDPHQAGVVSLPKLDCCGGSCLCPSGGCTCGSSCGGACLDHRFRVISLPVESPPPAPTPAPRSCCAGKKAATITA
ncbi:hypothetical protein EST38_g9276 [Candolleomyces aberdarensis]|uniref:Copper-fist domain-containing protein n=1 Tax=Candolleomyces aberdarensis TaxID=2316362 RepID=A0A4Q2DB55_9AGAR|nr:hypothetical protein EST38_g9276 [Candolleomyces aberdarensis]